jgi:ssDNA-binding Zn-finger/Zn-ribbon topoisomerase 1
VHELSKLQVREDEDDRRHLPEGRRRYRRAQVAPGHYPDCDFTLWKRPIAETCPDCGAPFLLEKITKKAGRQLICSKDDCAFVKDAPLQEEPVPA